MPGLFSLLPAYFIRTSKECSKLRAVPFILFVVWMSARLTKGSSFSLNSLCALWYVSALHILSSVLILSCANWTLAGVLQHYTAVRESLLPILVRAFAWLHSARSSWCSTNSSPLPPQSTTLILWIPLIVTCVIQLVFSARCFAVCVSFLGLPCCPTRKRPRNYTKAVKF